MKDYLEEKRGQVVSWPTSSGKFSLNWMIHQLIDQGQKFLGSDLYGPSAFNKWRTAVFTYLSANGAAQQDILAAKLIARADRPKNPESGRGLKPDDQQKVIRLLKILTAHTKTTVPQESVPQPILSGLSWDTTRLRKYLKDIDERIGNRNYEGAITLCYTCIEGFLNAFIVQSRLKVTGSLEIIAASKAVKNHLKSTLDSYPDEALTMITHICHTVDRARNRFSESHFEEKASQWLAEFLRDLTNSLIRLLLQFMPTAK